MRSPQVQNLNLAELQMLLFCTEKKISVIAFTQKITTKN